MCQKAQLLRLRKVVSLRAQRSNLLKKIATPQKAGLAMTLIGVLINLLLSVGWLKPVFALEHTQKNGLFS